jgi:hypothetical protein
MNESTIAGILRAAKPEDRRLHDGWVHSAIKFAELLRINNGCFDPLMFLEFCGVDGKDEHEWRKRYEGVGAGRYHSIHR